MARKPSVNEERQNRIEKALEVLDPLSLLRDEVQEIVDNLEEKFSATARYENMSDIAEKLDQAVSALEECQDIDFTAS